MMKFRKFALLLLCLNFPIFAQANKIFKHVQTTLADCFTKTPLTDNLVLVVPTEETIDEFSAAFSSVSLLSQRLKDYCSTLGNPIWIVDNVASLKEMCAIVEVPKNPILDDEEDKNE